VNLLDSILDAFVRIFDLAEDFDVVPNVIGLARFDQAVSQISATFGSTLYIEKQQARVDTVIANIAVALVDMNSLTIFHLDTVQSEHDEIESHEALAKPSMVDDQLAVVALEGLGEHLGTARIENALARGLAGFLVVALDAIGEETLRVRDYGSSHGFCRKLSEITQAKEEAEILIGYELNTIF